MQRFTAKSLTLSIILGCLVVSGCSTVYYKTMEQFGVHKRDLLKKAVIAARDDQKEAGEQFKDAMTRLKELYKFDGGKLETAYNQLKSEYDSSASKAQGVKKRVKDVEDISSDLFAEWDKEIGQISTPSLASNSRRQLQETKARYETMHTALKKAEQSMDPVLTQFKDHVLYLKHNLNAQAISSLKGESTAIQNDIGRLIEEMNRSISKADEFVKTLN